MKPRTKPYGTANACGANIERLRKQRSMRQREMVFQMQLRGVDINPSSYSKLEGQNRNCGDRELYAIAQILNVPMEKLMEAQA
jgi:transcriptional regulator with XRE-family HTH domain